ncbi:MAG: 50S ribosomal protein L23 [Acidobacteriales bacterium]|nr:50S ribosomal protein L23 [Terriglobales bacterium]
MRSLHEIIRRPVITEKGLLNKETAGTLVFVVAEDAGKTEIKEAVERAFKVKVADVRTANFAGKERRRGKFAGYKPDWKKAYVRLRAGEKMPEYAESV